MRDIDALQQRMDHAGERLAAAMAGRQQETRTLMETLGRLEQSFKEREEVLDGYRSLTAPMEQENRLLSELLERLLGQLEIDTGDNPPQAAPERDDREVEAILPEPDDISGTAPSAQRFEDVAPELLMEEERREFALATPLAATVEAAAEDSRALDEAELAAVMPEVAPDDIAGGMDEIIADEPAAEEAEEADEPAAEEAEALDDPGDAPPTGDPISAALDVLSGLSVAQPAPDTAVGATVDDGAAAEIDIPDPDTAPAQENAVMDVLLDSLGSGVAVGEDDKTSLNIKDLLARVEAAALQGFLPDAGADPGAGQAQGTPEGGGQPDADEEADEEKVA